MATFTKSLTKIVLVVAFAAVSLVGSAHAADSSAKKLHLGHLNSTAHLLAFVAKDAGFFQEEGIDAELLLFSSAAELSAGLESGKLDIAFIGSIPVVTFQSTGHPLVVFGGAMTNGHGYVIKKEKLPADFKEGDITVLKGKNVASVKNSVQDFELQVLLKGAGLSYGAPEEKKDVNVIYFASQTEAYNALKNATIDAVSVYSPYASRAQNEGYAVVYYCNEKTEFKDQPCCRQVATVAGLAKNPALYRAAERAFIKAYKFSQENHNETIKIVSNYIKLNNDLLEYEIYGGHSVSSPDPDRKATFSLKKGAVEFGYAKDYEIEPLYNIDIYRDALASLVKEKPNDKIYQGLQKHFDAEE